MKTILGFLLVIAGIILGLYMGVWVCLIGGIVQVVQSAVANPVDTWGVAYGLAKFFFAGLIGWLSFFVVGGIGLTLLK